MSNGLLIAGTGSNVGKSLIVTGLVRAAHRRGLDVTPFKGQNMALNSAVTASGEEIARAQALQARAAGVAPSVDMNPVLLKPQAAGSAQLIVEGRPAGTLNSDDWFTKASLIDRVVAAWSRLASRFDLIVAEGAGSAAEINLLEADLANVRLAEAVDAPVVLVADLEPGGAFAALVGHLVLLEERWPGRVRGFVINRVRGSTRILDPAVVALERRFDVRSYGMLPWLPVRVAGEDSLNLDAGSPGRCVAPVRVRVLRIPYLANYTDFDPLREERDVDLRFVTEPSELADADLVVIPGTKATVRALSWVRERGFASALARARAEGAWILGVCGGYQMLADTIEDEVESGAGQVQGLGLLDASVRFCPTKTTRLVSGTAPAYGGAAVAGYEIHHGEVATSEAPLFDLGYPEGAVRDRIVGTSLHGLLDSDAFREALFRRVAETRGRSFEPTVRWEDHVEAELDRLAEAVEAHLDVEGLLALAGGSAARS